MSSRPDHSAKCRHEPPGYFGVLCISSGRSVCAHSDKTVGVSRSESGSSTDKAGLDVSLLSSLTRSAAAKSSPVRSVSLVLLTGIVASDRPLALTTKGSIAKLPLTLENRGQRCGESNAKGALRAKMVLWVPTARHIILLSSNKPLKRLAALTSVAHTSHGAQSRHLQHHGWR